MDKWIAFHSSFDGDDSKYQSTAKHLETITLYYVNHYSIDCIDTYYRKDVLYVLLLFVHINFPPSNLRGFCLCKRGTDS